MSFGEHFRALRKAEARADGTGHVDLQQVTALEVAACAEGLEAVADGALSREDAARRMVDYLFETFRVAETGEPACALVRCFQTCALGALPPPRKAFATRQLGSLPYREDMRCLTLLATRGTEPEWNRVEDSAGHLAIPLPSVEVILRAPMIARLLLQMGVRYDHVVAPPEGEELLLDAQGGVLNVFHVARARGSRYIPAQASFVYRHGVRSVLGFGGLSPAGELFATVLFTRVPVARETAEQFRALASIARSVLLGFPPEHTFAA